MSELWSFDPYLEHPDQPVAGFDVRSEDDSVGTVIDTVHDDAMSFLVVETGGLLHKKHVVIPAGLVKQINADAEKIFLRVDKAELNLAPELEEGWRQDPTWPERATACFPTQVR